MRGDVVTAPGGTEVVLVDVGSTQLVDTEVVRVWDVALPPGGRHPWHLHHNPYVVLSVAGSTGRMDWLDGAPAREITEYTGGAVFRPVSPIHCLTNTGGTPYRNRLVELKEIGERRAEGVLDVGAGSRSAQGVVPAGLPAPSDGREPVLACPYVRIWTVKVPAGGAVDLDLDPVAHVVAELDAALEGTELTQSISSHAGGPTRLTNAAGHDRIYFVVALDYRSTYALAEEAGR